MFGLLRQTTGKNGLRGEKKKKGKEGKKGGGELGGFPLKRREPRMRSPTRHKKPYGGAWEGLERGWGGGVVEKKERCMGGGGGTRGSTKRKRKG